MIHLRYFANLKESIGFSQESLVFQDGLTPGDLVDLLTDRGDPWRQALSGRNVLRVAINHQMARWDSEIHDGDEVALFPPVTGG